VVVIGQQNLLRVWNRSTFEERQERLSDDELRELAALGF